MARKQKVAHVNASLAGVNASLAGAGAGADPAVARVAHSGADR